MRWRRLWWRVKLAPKVLWPLLKWVVGRTDGGTFVVTFGEVGLPVTGDRPRLGVLRRPLYTYHRVVTENGKALYTSGSAGGRAGGEP